MLAPAADTEMHLVLQAVAQGGVEVVEETYRIDRSPSSSAHSILRMIRAATASRIAAGTLSVIRCFLAGTSSYRYFFANPQLGCAPA